MSTKQRTQNTRPLWTTGGFDDGDGGNGDYDGAEEEKNDIDGGEQHSTMICDGLPEKEYVKAQKGIVDDCNRCCIYNI